MCDLQHTNYKQDQASFNHFPCLWRNLNAGLHRLFIYLRTAQTVMGHASMAVTLGYLRGLEVGALNADEMPEL